MDKLLAGDFSELINQPQPAPSKRTRHHKAAKSAPPGVSPAPTPDAASSDYDDQVPGMPAPMGMGPSPEEIAAQLQIQQAQQAEAARAQARAEARRVAQEQLAAAERNRYIAPEYNPNLGKPLYKPPYQPHDGDFFPDMAREVEASLGSLAQGMGRGFDRLTGSSAPGIIASLGEALTANAKRGMSDEHREARSQTLINNGAIDGNWRTLAGSLASSLPFMLFPWLWME